MNPTILLAAALTVAPSAQVVMHAAPGPDAFPNARSVVWIPEIRHPLASLELGVRAAFYNVRRDCRVDNCSTTGVGNPALSLAWYFEVGATPEPPPPAPSGSAVRPEVSDDGPPPASPGWITRVAARVHAPLSDPDLDDGRSARAAGLLAPELWPDLTPDALPIVLEADTRKRLNSWFATEGRLLLAGLVPTSGDGGVLAALKADAHFVVVGRDPLALSVFGRGLFSVDSVEGGSAMFSPVAGARVRLGSGPVPRLQLEIAARFVAWHSDDVLPESFFPGYSASLAVGFP